MNLLSHNPILFLILYAVIAVGLIAVPQIGFKKTSASRTIGFTAQLIGLCLATLSFAGIITLEYAPGAAIFFGALALLFGWGYVVIKAHIFVHDAYDCFLLLGVGMWVQSVGWIFFWLAVIIFNSDAQPINYYIFFVAALAMFAIALWRNVRHTNTEWHGNEVLSGIAITVFQLILSSLFLFLLVGAYFWLVKKSV